MYGPSRGIEAFEEIHTQVTDRIPMIYAEILDFSFSVKKHMSRSKGGKSSSISYEFKHEIHKLTFFQADLLEDWSTITRRLISTERRSNPSKITIWPWQNSQGGRTNN